MVRLTAVHCCVTIRRNVDVLAFYHTYSVLVDAEFAAAAGSTYNHDDDMP